MTTTTTSFERRVFSLWDAVSLTSFRNGAIAGVVAAVVAIVTAIVVMASPATYESRATLSIDQPRAIAASPDAGVVEKLDRLRLKYAGLADTDAITGPVSRATGVSRADVRDHTGVYAGPESLLLFPTATADTERGASRLASTMADALTRFADREQARAQVGPGDRFHLTVIEPASDPTKVSPTSRIATAAAAFAALVSLGLAYVALQLATAKQRLV
jgi:uncharacterized protein involved in exopolysaccharide biosynthesis